MYSSDFHLLDNKKAHCRMRDSGFRLVFQPEKATRAATCATPEPCMCPLGGAHNAVPHGKLASSSPVGGAGRPRDVENGFCQDEGATLCCYYFMMR